MLILFNNIFVIINSIINLNNNKNNIKYMNINGNLSCIGSIFTQRDSYRCFVCSWVVKEDGPCLVFDKEKCYGWKTLEERPKFLS